MTGKLKALIVHAHPEPQSFCAAQMHEAAAVLRSAGHETEILDLYALNWNPLLGLGDFRHPLPPHFKPQAEQLKAVQGGTLAPDVQGHLEKLRAADLLIFSFPLWWFALPAILKGWVDRVFVMGGVYGGGIGTYAGGAFVGRRALLLFTTGGPAQAYGPQGRNGDLDTILFPIQHGILHFAGYTVLEPVVTHAPVRADEAQRRARLAEVRAAFASLDTRGVVFG